MKPLSFLLPLSLFLTGLFLVIGSSAEAGLLRRSVSATVESGKLEGAKINDIERFLGVPYASPPTGSLRWRPPAAPLKWEGKRDATSFGASCMQAPIPVDPQSRDQSPWVQIPTDRAGKASEDCLFLNIWRPAEKSQTALPVMVWFHGGSFISDSGANTDYDGAAFARAGVILITVNYRLGRLGFFAHPALTAEQSGAPVGNYGLMDAMASLEWVKRNIQAFGGDPANVTIFGQSSGAALVNLLMVSPSAQGLFQRAIAESAPGFRQWPMLQAASKSGPSAEEKGKVFAVSAGITGDDAAALRALPAEKVIGSPWTDKEARATPIIDGKIVVESEAAAFAAGHQTKVPYLTGANSYEGSILRYFNDPPADIINEFGKNKDRVTALYQWRDNQTAVATALYGDNVYVMPARYLARKAADAGQPTYLYHFAFVQRELQGKAYGAAHGAEICIMFETCEQSERPTYVPRTTDKRMGTAMRTYWVNFARTGDPNGSNLASWPAYKAASDEIMWFSNSGTLVMPYYQRERLDALEAASPYTPVTAGAVQEKKKRRASK